MIRFVPLLEAEQAEDEAVLRERLSSWSLQKLKQEGYCITDLSAYWLDNYRYGRPVAAFTLGPGIALPPEHRFEYARLPLGFCLTNSQSRVGTERKCL